MEKIARITNDKFSWVLNVDGIEILFSGGNVADYFEKHYSEIGYKVIRDNDKWKRPL